VVVSEVGFSEFKFQFEGIEDSEEHDSNYLQSEVRKATYFVPV